MDTHILTCPHNCQPTDLSQFLSMNQNNPEIYIGTTANYISNFFSSFINLMILDPSSDLYPYLHDANLKLPIGNFSKIILASWPNSLKNLNSKIAGGETLSEEEIRSYILFIESQLTTTIKVAELRFVFNLSENAAQLVSDLALKYQRIQDVDRCVHLPSEITMIKKQPVENGFQTVETERAYNNFRFEMEMRLLSVCEGDLSEDLESWLYRMEDDGEVNVVDLDEKFLVIFSNGNSVEIPHELELSKLIDENCFRPFE